MKLFHRYPIHPEVKIQTRARENKVQFESLNIQVQLENIQVRLKEVKNFTSKGYIGTLTKEYT